MATARREHRARNCALQMAQLPGRSVSREPFVARADLGLTVAFGEFHHIDGTVVGTVSEGVDARPERGADSEAG